MASFDPRVYHQMHAAAAMHHQSVMNAGRYAPAAGIPHQAAVHGAGSQPTSLSSLGGAGLHGRGVGLPSAGAENSNGVGKVSTSAASATARGVSNSPFTRGSAGPSWPNTYRAAQNIAFPDARQACGDRVAELVEDLAKGIGCPVEQVLVPLLPCVGGLMGTNTSIRVHRGWSEPPVVWTMVGAAPGSRRSAVIRQLLAPILTLQAEKAASRHTGSDYWAAPGGSRGCGGDGAGARGTVADGKCAGDKDTEKREPGRALYSGTRISLGALTEVLHRNTGHAFSLTENVEHLHEMLGLSQLPAVAAAAAASSVSCPSSRLVSVMEDLYEGLPLVAVEDGRVTTIQGSNFCHGGFSSPEYMVAMMLKYPGWLSSRLLISCPQADNMKSTFGLTTDDADLPELAELYAILLDKHSEGQCRYTFSQEAAQDLNTFFDDEWSAVFNQLDQNEHEGIIIKSMGQIVRLCGILKALENSINVANAASNSETHTWDWEIGLDTVKSGVALGKYFLEQKLAMTFMVSTGFFNHSTGNSQDSSMNEGNGNGSGNDSQDSNKPSTLPHTATSDRLDEISFPGSQGAMSGGQLGTGHMSNTSLASSSSFNLPPTGLHRSGSRGQDLNLSQNLNLGQSMYNPSLQPDLPFGLPKKMGEVDFSTLPVTMTTAEEDVSEMMQAVDFVHFSKTQFVGVHGRRIKRLMECYDDGHGVSATTAAQKSITPPVHIEGTNNRHPAWASALFFQKVAELGLGVAEQNRHPTNKKVCWRFKRKPLSQLSEADFKLLHYLRVEMDKYSQFGTGPFNPSDMVNSGLLTVPPSSSPGPLPLHLGALSSDSNPITDNLDDSSSESNTKDRDSMNIKTEVF